MWFKSWVVDLRDFLHFRAMKQDGKSGQTADFFDKMMAIVLPYWLSVVLLALKILMTLNFDVRPDKTMPFGLRILLGTIFGLGPAYLITRYLLAYVSAIEILTEFDDSDLSRKRQKTFATGAIGFMLLLSLFYFLQRH